MKKTLLISLILLLTLCTLSAATISSPAATVNLTKNKVISTSDLNKEVESYKAQGYSVTPLEVLNAMIESVLIEQGAARDGYTVSNSDVESLYAQQKQSIESQYGAKLTNEEFEKIVLDSYETVDAFKQSLKENYVTQLYVNGEKADIVNNVATPTEREIKTWYRQNSSQFSLPERVRLSVIAKTKSDDEAKNSEAKAILDDVYSKIKNGSLTFEKAVPLYTDDKDSVNQGGDWGYMTDTQYSRAQMGDDFVEDAMLLEPGDIAGVYETPNLYCIVKCTVHADPAVLGLDDKIEDYNMTVREYITQGLTYQNAQYAYINAYNALIEDLRSQAKINIIYK